MTQQPLTDQQLDDIEQRASARRTALSGWLNCYSPLSEQDALENAEAVLEEDVPALLAEIRHLKGQRKFLFGALTRKDAQSGEADRAVREFLGLEEPCTDPRAELAAAAEHLRTATPAVAGLVRARTSLAHLLVAVASNTFEDGHVECEAGCRPETCDLSAALAVARALVP